LNIRARLFLLILFATLIPALVGGMQFFERRDFEIADAQRDLIVTARYGVFLPGGGAGAGGGGSVAFGRFLSFALNSGYIVSAPPSVASTGK